MKKDKIKLDGVHKLSWATTIEKELGRLKGVRSALLNFEEKVIHVGYDETAVELMVIESKVEEVLQRFRNKGFVNK